MNYSKYIIATLLFFSGFKTLGQQNLFNVPSSDITLRGEPFFQQQINLYPTDLQLNSTFCWGLGKQTEIGFNVLEVNVSTTTGTKYVSNSDPKSPPLYPVYLLNFQKAFVLSPSFKIGIGTQGGISVGSHFVNYNYLNLVTAIPTFHTKLITGLYGGNNSYLGPETRMGLLKDYSQIGYHAGIEVQVFPEKFSLIAEAISGKHSLGESSFGAAYFVSPNWILSGAYLRANKGSSSENAAVAEITFSPSSKLHLRLFKHGHQIHKSTT